MNVVLVFFDTMRYDHASFNGYVRNTTPTLDDLARQATVFTNCYATDVPTQPSFTATFTGQRGIRTGVVTHGLPEETISIDLETFPVLLARRGVLTASISTLYRFRRWFAQGFVHNIEPNINKWLQYVSCEDVNGEAIPWIQAYAARRQFLLFLHYWDPHERYNFAPKRYVEKFYTGDPYDPSNKSLEDLRSRSLLYFFLSGGVVPELKDGLTDIEYPISQYDAEINYADEHFGDVLGALSKAGVLEDTMIVFTSDHGEALRGEHGLYFDHMDAYEQVAHVPLFIWAPGRVRPQSVDALVQHTDLAPTILEAFGLESPPSWDGRSLWPVLRGETAKHRNFVVTNQGLWSAQRAYRNEHWAIMRTYAQGMVSDAPQWELFDRQNDPTESHDLSADKPLVLKEMKLALLDWVDRELGGKPDPLRIAAQDSAAVNNVKRRYEAWLAATANAAAGGIGPGVRGRIDADPAGYV